MPYGTSVFEKPIDDQWIYLELNLPQRQLFQKVKFIVRTKDGDSNVTGSHDPNLFLNDLTFDVGFSDREIKEYSANVSLKIGVR